LVPRRGVEVEDLVKLVVVEDGSELTAKLWGSAYSAASSILAYPEGRAALAAARRLDRLGEKEHREALATFEELYGELIAVGVDQELACALVDMPKISACAATMRSTSLLRSNLATKKSFWSPGIGISLGRLNALG